MPFAIIPWIISNSKLLAIGAAILALLGAVFWVGHLEHQLAVEKAAAVVSKDQAVIDSGQAAATQSAAAIETARQQADSSSEVQHQVNENAIKAAPGASAPIDPRLNAAGRLGLCRDSAYAGSPQCVGLLKDHP